MHESLEASVRGSEQVGFSFDFFFTFVTNVGTLGDCQVSNQINFSLLIIQAAMYHKKRR